MHIIATEILMRERNKMNKFEKRKQSNGLMQLIIIKSSGYC